MKDKLGGKTKTQFVALSPKTYGFLINNGDENKKAKDTKKVCYKTKS